MDSWYEFEETYLYKKTLDEAVNFATLGMLLFTGNFVLVKTVIENLNQKLKMYFPKLVDKIGVKLGNVSKKMIQGEIQVNYDVSWINRTNRVIILESDSMDTYEAKNALYKIYNRGLNENLHFRYVPSVGVALLSDDGRRKHKEAWMKHEKDMSSTNAPSAN